MEKGGRREIKVQEAEEQGAGGSDPLSPHPALKNKLHQIMHLLLPILLYVMK